MKRKKRCRIYVKYRLRHVRRRLHKRIKGWKDYWKNEYRDTRGGLSALSAVLLALICGVTVMEIGVQPAIPLFFIGAAGGTLLFFLARLVLKLVLRLISFIFRSGKPEEWNVPILLSLVAAALIIMGAYRTDSLLFILFGLMAAVVELLFGRSLWAFFHNRRRTLPVILILLLTFTINGFLVYFLVSGGVPDDDMERYRAFAEELVEEQTEEEEGKPEEGGTTKMQYPVASFTYGTGEADYQSGSADLSLFVEYEGFTEWVRTLYWGTGIEEVPLAGSVWYPDCLGTTMNQSQEQGFPILFIVHGNHIMTEDSHLGYAYLGEYLAARGYIVVSVDENFLNGFIDGGLDYENDARAVLLLENIRWMKEWSGQEISPLQGIVDFENIILAGHSRGGEAVAIAALFNELDRYPEAGHHTFDYHFPIQSLIAIAPSCNQYAPAGKTPELTDINYFLIHGSHDGDVSSVIGMKQYDKVTFTGDKECFKAYLYIGGANHGQFNTSWGEYDQMLPTGWYLNTEALLTKEEQQQILCSGIQHFLEASIRDSLEDKEFFTNSGAWTDDLPVTVYTQGYRDSTYTAIADFEEDSDLESISSGLGYITTARLWGWSEQQLSEDTGTYTSWLDDHAVHLWWSNWDARYQLTLDKPLKLTEQSLLCFDVMNLEIPEEEEELRQLDFSIALTDGGGKTMKVDLQPYGVVVPPLPVRLSKAEYLTGEECYKHQFVSIRIPLTDFPGLDYSAITSITLRFNKTETGEVMLDNIGFSGPLE